jgi:pimeloyl-ACP methyl ester carboxylesterase
MMNKSEIKLDLPDVSVAANLSQPVDPDALVIFVHGPGGSHSNSQYNLVADVLNENNISTLIVDLLTAEEDQDQTINTNIEFLRPRLVRLTEKAIEQFAFDKLPVGYFGIGAGASTSFEAAAFLGDRIKAIVCLGAQAELSKNLKEVKASTLLIEGSLDNDNIEVNKGTYDQLTCDKKIEIVNGASQSFGEPGALNEAATLASAWFDLYLCNKEVNQSTH